MKNALAYEWFRVRSLRSTWALLVAAGVLQFASGLYWGLKTDLGTLDPFVSSLGIVATLGAILVAALGVCAFSLDYQHGTIVTTGLVVRSPARIVLARSLVIGALSLAGGLLMVGSALAGVLAGGGTPDPGRSLTAGAGVLALVVLSGLAGLALGGLLRHTAAGVGVFAVWVLVAETLLATLADVPMTALPFGGTAALAGAGVTTWAGPVSFVVLIAVALGGLRFTLARRDC